jgi:hypothetical protein
MTSLFGTNSSAGQKKRSTPVDEEVEPRKTIDQHIDSDPTEVVSTFSELVIYIHITLF